LGTVQGDIHDIGKDVLGMLLACHGFTVHDLGVDVRPERFVEAALEHKPDILGLSGLLTAAYTSMQDTVALLREATSDWSPRPYIIIGGGRVDEEICRYVGADYWTVDAMEGVHLCQRLMVERLQASNASSQ
jgi:methanogenic corrinoid protein MtbC1